MPHSKLCFLGQTYSSSENQIEIIPKEHTAHFLGRRSTLRRPFQTVNSPLGVRKKYRGVTYCV